MSEKWKSVVGYEGLYEVSDMGNVRRIANGHKWSDIANPRKVPRYNKLHNLQGYRLVRMSKGGVSISRTVHRIVAFAFLGNPPIGKTQINHKNFNRADNRPCNLEWCSVEENNMHSWANDRLRPRRGIDNGRSKLDEVSVKEIRSISGEKQADIAKRFHVSNQLISRIRAGLSWKHVKGAA